MTSRVEELQRMCDNINENGGLDSGEWHMALLAQIAQNLAVIADVMLADRKTENSSEKPNNWEDFFREPTAEERKAVADYIDSISIPTGVNVFDLMDEPQKSCSTCGYSPQTPSCDTCDGYSNWWSLDDEPQTGQSCDGCEYLKPYIEYKCTHHSCKFEDEPETERSE